MLPGSDPADARAGPGRAARARPGDARDRRPVRAARAVDRAALGRRRHRLRRRHLDAVRACTGTATRLDARRRLRRAATARSPGQTYGWDAVLALGAAWFLDNGEGSERYVGTFRGQGISSAPLHLVRVDLATGSGHAHRDLRAARTAWSRTRRSSTSARASSSATTAATACSPRSTSPPTAARRRAGGASRTTPATRCCSPTPVSSSRTITTRRAWPTRSSCSTSSPATSGCGSTPEVRCSPCSSRRRLRPRLLLLLVRRRDPGCSRTLRVSSRAGSQVTTW